MIIIAGAGHPKSEKYITKQLKHCTRCNNTNYWILEKIKYHVTLFFMPVVPYKTEYVLFCSICGHKIILEKEDFERMVRYDARPYNTQRK